MCVRACACGVYDSLKIGEGGLGNKARLVYFGLEDGFINLRVENLLQLNIALTDLGPVTFIRYCQNLF